MPGIRHALSALLVISTASAQAIGFGQLELGTALGQRLDAKIVLTEAPGEAVNPKGIWTRLESADSVFLGDVFVTLQVLRTGMRLHLTSSSTIDEPAMKIFVETTCVGVVSRSYHVLLDPVTLPYAAGFRTITPPARALAEGEPTVDHPAGVAIAQTAPARQRKKLVKADRNATAAPRLVNTPKLNDRWAGPILPAGPGTRAATARPAPSETAPQKTARRHDAEIEALERRLAALESTIAALRQHSELAIRVANDQTRQPAVPDDKRAAEMATKSKGREPRLPP